MALLVFVTLSTLPLFLAIGPELVWHERAVYSVFTNCLLLAAVAFLQTETGLWATNLFILVGLGVALVLWITSYLRDPQNVEEHS